MTQRKPRIVAVDDEEQILAIWKRLLGGASELVVFDDPLKALDHFGKHDVDVALIDLQMAGMDGLQLLGRLRTLQPRAQAIVITGRATVETAVEAMKLGAYDFLTKPIEDMNLARQRIEGAYERKMLREANAGLKSRLDAYGPNTQLVGDSRAMRSVRELIAQAASAPSPVLIQGESGTGKELVARALHDQSPRSGQAFLPVNCAAMSETLIDSELFGHERGAFTGANASHKGLFEAADRGTLFLDEIGDVPLETQVRLLRVLQEGEVRPVGSTRTKKVDVRVIVATNVDLEKAMKRGTFREDLFYRVSTFRVGIPPLRERSADVPLIAQHLLQKAAKRIDKKISGFTDAAMALLVGYSWPGNVRELNNAVEFAVTLCQAESVDAEDLPPFVSTKRLSPADRGTGSDLGNFSEARTRAIEDFERGYLTQLMALCDGNVSEASRRSGIDRANLRRLLARLGLEELKGG